MGFTPASGKFITETQGHRKSRSDSNGVLGIPSSEQGAPIHFGWGWVEQETGNRPIQKRLQAGEGRLSKLA